MNNRRKLAEDLRLRNEQVTLQFGVVGTHVLPATQILRDSGASPVVVPQAAWRRDSERDIESQMKVDLSEEDEQDGEREVHERKSLPSSWIQVRRTTESSVSTLPS